MLETALRDQLGDGRDGRAGPIIASAGRRAAGIFHENGAI